MNSEEKHIFTCYTCDRTFVSGWTDEEAQSELRDSFGTISVDDCVQVCDDCYKLMMVADDHA